MTVKELMNKLDLTLVSGSEGLSKEITGGFVGDLLSVVMGKAKEGHVWVTIQGHFNIVAVASLVDVSCIIVTEGFKVEANAIEKADEEEIPILTSKCSSYGVVTELVKLGIE